MLCAAATVAATATIDAIASSVFFSQELHQCVWEDVRKGRAGRGVGLERQRPVAVSGGCAGVGDGFSVLVVERRV